LISYATCDRFLCTMSRSNKKQQQYVDDNPVEAVKSLGSDLKKGITEDLLKESGRAFWKQMLGATEEVGGKDYKDSTTKPSGDLSEGAELKLEDLKRKTEALMPRVEAGINYAAEVIHAEKRAASENTQELKVRMEEISIELKQLMKTSKELQIEFKDVDMEEIPEAPGKYHLTFLEWVLDTIRKARLKVEESGAWLEAFYSKKSKRKYWNMFKKHGTTFGLSGERVVATQTG